MKNIIEAKPTNNIHGRILFNTLFADQKDIIKKDILDIGCGYGWFELHAVTKDCKKVVGIDLTDEDLKTARTHATNKKIAFQIGSAVDLPFKNNVFDTVVSWDVIEHIPKNMEDKMFQEVNRVLRKNGVFYLSTPSNNFFVKIFDPAWWLIGHRHYKKDDFIKFSKKNGFKIEKITLNGGFWEILGIYNLYIAKWVFRRKPFFESLFDRKQDEEFRKGKGYASLFIKLRKL